MGWVLVGRVFSSSRRWCDHRSGRAGRVSFHVSFRGWGPASFAAAVLDDGPRWRGGREGAFSVPEDGTGTMSMCGYLMGSRGSCFLSVAESAESASCSSWRLHFVPSSWITVPQGPHLTYSSCFCSSCWSRLAGMSRSHARLLFGTRSCAVLHGVCM